MCNPQRYSANDWPSVESDTGEFVLYEDYAALRATADQWREMVRKYPAQAKNIIRALQGLPGDDGYFAPSELETRRAAGNLLEKLGATNG